MRRKTGRWIYVLGSLLACAILVAIAFFYLEYTTSKTIPSTPIVSISDTYPESPVPVDQSVVVFGQARGPEGIAEVQWWVNGRMIASQSNPDPETDQPFEVSQAWIPTGPGNFLILLRAIDGKGRAGQSDPVMVEVVERAFTYEVAPGDTVESIADAFDTTPEELSERNPGVGDTPAPGTPMDVPALPGGGGGGGGLPPAGGEGDGSPRVDPPEEPPPPSGDETPVETDILIWWRALDINILTCLMEPWVCSSSPVSDEPPSPPIDVSAELNESCQVVVRWLDRADNEIGFRIYRTTLGSGARPELVGPITAVPTSGDRISFTDRNPPNGRFSYAVSAYNTSGEIWSPPSDWVTVDCPRETGERTSLSVEAVEMTVRDSYERVYCYVSLAGSPFERVPAGSSFLELESGTWNIAAHFSGENKRTVFVDRSTPLDIVAECLGWQGDTLVNMGRFSRSHPPEEWDGRNLMAGPSDASYQVTYRINYTDTGGYGGGGLGAPVDPSFPPPYDLRATDSWRRCEAAGSGVACHGVPEPGLTWSYDVRSGERHTFRVYARSASDLEPHLAYESFRGFTYAPQSVDDCNETIYYYVSAVVGVDPMTGEAIESLPSEELEVGPSCSQLEITLLDLQVFSAPDGDPGTDFCLNDCGASVEAYGWLNFNGHVLKWNNHEGCDSIDGCLAGPAFTSLSPGLHSWADMSFGSVRSSGFSRNVLRIPIEDGQDLKVLFDFWDHDSISPDDLWCGWDLGRSSGLHARQNAYILEPRSLAEWFALDQEFTVRPTTEWSTCEITFHIRAIP